MAQVTLLVSRGIRIPAQVSWARNHHNSFLLMLFPPCLCLSTTMTVILFTSDTAASIWWPRLQKTFLPSAS